MGSIEMSNPIIRRFGVEVQTKNRNIKDKLAIIDLLVETDGIYDIGYVVTDSEIVLFSDQTALMHFLNLLEKNGF